MRRTLISLLWCIAAIGYVSGQQTFEEPIQSESPVNIALDEVKKVFVAPAPQLKSATAKSTITVNYVNFPEAAKAAFQYAASIWEHHISSPVPINIRATWEELQGNIIAQSRPALFYKNFKDAPLPDVYYPVVLTEKFTGKAKNAHNEPDILCSFNLNKSFYFGTDGQTPASQYDFVTVALHEIAHGLGISGFISNENGMGTIKNPSHSPSSYDYYIFNASKQQITNPALFASPSSELHRQITSDQLNFSSIAQVNRPISAIFAPGTWRDGASIYHIKEGNCSTNDSHLMTPYSYKGEAIHNIGDNTLQILAEIGWKDKVFKMTALKDAENSNGGLPVAASSLSGYEISTLQLVFSTNNFSTKDSVALNYNPANQQFEGSIPLSNYQGEVWYYYRAKNPEGQLVTYPSSTLHGGLTFTIGRDYYPPELAHNPSKIIVNNEIEFTAVASDNVAIGSVKIEYRINGKSQKPLTLTPIGNETYTGRFKIPVALKNTDIVDYRIVARDNTARKNKKCLPASGLFSVKVFEPFLPVRSYFSDFDTPANDFTISDFEINRPHGFTNANLHTLAPYPESSLENEKYELAAHLNYPVILEENGQMTFDEIVLVEPGEEGASCTEKTFKDFVVVEASKDHGTTWHALVNAYDSSINPTWESRFSNTLKSSSSAASGHENMFWQQSIDLTGNPEFSAGDTVLFRFRLASDHFINGWGWAIDNLQIQNTATANQEIASSGELEVYPNPFSNFLYIDCTALNDQAQVEIEVSDLTGKTVYRETNYEVRYSPRIKIDLSAMQRGVYLARIVDAQRNSLTKRIVKH